jgi:hypothetical protein
MMSDIFLDHPVETQFCRLRYIILICYFISIEVFLHFVIKQNVGLAKKCLV